MLRNKIRTAIGLFSLALMAACGSGGGSTDAVTGDSSAAGADPMAMERRATLPTEWRPGPGQASRFLAQATFGPTMKSIDEVVAKGYDGWIDDQFTKPQTSHRVYLDAILAKQPPGGYLLTDNFIESFWQQAALGDDQLRQRVSYALSQIFVISTQLNALKKSTGAVASYSDMLGANAFGNFRTLLESVTLHPAMGLYLSSIREVKEEGERTPDENYAREVMQLMTIGLTELNQDGSPKLAGGLPVDTYTLDDVKGLAKVFTGWSWYGPTKSKYRFFDTSNMFVNGHCNSDRCDPERMWKPMMSYPQYHSTSEKKFLGVTIPAQGTPDPEASLKIALDRLFNHPNVGPFIGRQLIQRLVTSNPSPRYIARVAAVFADNGHGVRGDMKAVIKAVLLDHEARRHSYSVEDGHGKVREPVLRLANWMRAFHATSRSGRFLLSNMNDPASLGQTPFRAASVFNFYRPGYVPPNTTIADAGLVAPEMQIVGETAVAGYLNTMNKAITSGIGDHNDVQADYSDELALVATPEALIDRINLLLLANRMSPFLHDQILQAVNGVTISATNPATADQAKMNRVQLAIFLTMASSEYIVQK